MTRQPSLILEQIFRLQELIFEKEDKYKQEIQRLLHRKELLKAELLLAREQWRIDNEEDTV